MGGEVGEWAEAVLKVTDLYGHVYVLKDLGMRSRSEVRFGWRGVERKKGCWIYKSQRTQAIIKLSEHTISPGVRESFAWLVMCIISE
jgi:hypothetical protein